MQVSQSVKLAGIIVLLVVIYFLARGLFTSGSDGNGAEATRPNFVVVAETTSAQEWRDEIIIRGRTEAEKKVIVRAETSGAVAETPAEQGARVSAGDVLCRLSVDARKAQLVEARAAFAKAQLDYDAAIKLNEEGFRSDSSVAAAKAARDQAAAQVERARLELSKTDIAAPFDGIFDKRFVETGDFLNVGDPCGAMIQPEPFLVTGAVSEREVGKIATGDRGTARLATGETVEGTVRFLAAAADPATRTFDVELAVPNEDGNLRDGVTAEFTVYAEKREAHLVPRSSLVLNDEGEIGIRSLTSDNIVQFEPVRLIGEEANGVWVDGLDGDVRLITGGQGYVAAGQKVDVADKEEVSGEAL